MKGRGSGLKCDPIIRDTPEFRDAWMSGIPTAEIASAMGVAQPTVSRAARRMGLPRRRRGTLEWGQNRILEADE